MHSDRERDPESGHFEIATGDGGAVYACVPNRIRDFWSPRHITHAKGPEFRGSFGRLGHCAITETGWLPWEDSNSHVRSDKLAFEMSRVFGLKTANWGAEIFSI